MSQSVQLRVLASVLVLSLCIIDVTIDVTAAQEPNTFTRVPNVAAKSAHEAAKAIQGAELTAKFHLGKSPPTAKQGLTVYKQEPAAGTTIRQGSSVQVTVYAQVTGSGSEANANNAATTSRAGVVVNHALQQNGSVRALDLNHGAGSQRLFVERIFMPGGPDSGFGPGWVDANVMQLVDLGEEVVVTVGNVVHLLGLREGDEYPTADGATIRKFADGWEATLRDGTIERFDSEGRQAQFRSPGVDPMKFLYDAEGRLTRIDAGPENSLKYTYDSTGHIAAVDGPESLRVTYTYDENGQLQAVVNIWNNRVLYEYGTQGELRAARDDYGNVTSLAFVPASSESDVRREVVSVDATRPSLDRPALPPSAPAPKVEIDDHGRVISRTQRGETTSYAYDEQGRLASETTMAGTTSLTYDEFGRIATVVPAAGRPLAFSYNALDLPVRIAAGSDSWEAYEYNEHGDITRYASSDGNWEEYSYDGVGRLLELRQSPGLSKRYEYDAQDRLMSIQYGTGASVTYNYDEFGRLSKEQWSTGESTIREYNDSNRLARIIHNGLPTTIEHDEFGRIVATSDPVHGRKAFDYSHQGSRELLMTWDDHGQWTRQTNVDLNELSREFDNGTLRRRSHRRYDDVGRLASVMSAGNRRWTYQHDELGRWVGVDLPGGQRLRLTRNSLGLITSIERDGITSREFLYGADGKLRMETSPLGVAGVYSHDAAGHVTMLVEPAGPVNFEWNEAGQLTTIVGPGYQVTQAHHPDGSLAQREYVKAGLAFSFPLDEFGRPGGIALNEVHIRYEYGPTGAVRKIVLPGERTIQIDRDQAGRPVTFDYGAGIAVNLSYDHVDRIAGIQSASPQGESPLSETYAFDGVGNLTQLAVAGQPPRQMSYDDDDRLLGVFSPQDLVSFEYDHNDNLQTVRSKGGATEWSLDRGGRPVSRGIRASYEWDAGGNLTRLSGRFVEVDNTFDAADRLTRRQVGEHIWTFGYLPDGDRLWSEGPEGRKWFAYLPSGLIGMKDEAEVAWLVVNLPGTDLPLALCGSNGTTHLLLADRMFSIRRVLDLDGNVVASSDYGPYGNVEANTGDVPLAMFAGMVRDSHGLYYARRRYYDPALFRFISFDSWIGSPETPDSHHGYAYAANNPYRYRDPLGAETEQEWIDRMVKELRAQAAPPSGDHTSGNPYDGYSPYDFDDPAWTDDLLQSHHDDLRAQQYTDPTPSGRGGWEAHQRSNSVVNAELHAAEQELQRRGLREVPQWRPNPYSNAGNGTPNPPAGQGAAGRKDLTEAGPSNRPAGRAGGGTQVSPPRGEGTPGRPYEPTIAGEGRPSAVAGNDTRSIRPGGNDGTLAGGGRGGPVGSDTQVLPKRPGATDPTIARAPGANDPTIARPPGANDPTIARPPGANDPTIARPPGANDPTIARPPGANDPTIARRPGPYDPTIPGTPDVDGPPRWGGEPPPGNRTRPYTSPRGTPRGRTPSGIPLGGAGAAERGILTQVARGVGHGLVAVDILTAVWLLYDKSRDVIDRRDIVNQALDARQRRQDRIRGWEDVIDQALNQQGQDDRRFDVLPNADGSMPSRDDLVRRMHSNVYNGLPPFSGILTNPGGADQRGDFNNSLAQAEVLLGKLEDTTQELQDRTNSINKLLADANSLLGEAEATPLPKPADLEDLKRETQELRDLTDQARQAGGGGGKNFLAQQARNWANEVCTGVSQQQHPDSDALSNYEKLYDKLNKDFAESDPGNLKSALRAKADRVRMLAYDANTVFALNGGGEDGGVSLQAIRDKLSQAQQLQDAPEFLQQQEQLAEDAAAFLDLVLPWSREPDAQTLLIRYRELGNSGADSNTASVPSVEDMEKRLAAIQEKLDKFPDARTLRNIIQSANQAVADADELTDALPDADESGSGEIDQQFQKDMARMRGCIDKLRSRVPTPASVDMFGSLDPTRPQGRSPDTPPIVPIMREIFVALGPPKTHPGPRVISPPKPTPAMPAPPTLAKDHPIPQEPPKSDLDGTYSGASLPGMAGGFTWKQVDADTAQVTIQLDGREANLLKQFGLPPTATVTAKRVGNSYVVPQANPLSTALNNAGANLSRSLGGVPANVGVGLKFTPNGKQMRVDAKYSNGAATTGSATRN